MEGALSTAALASGATYRSFADATRAVLDLLERHLPHATVYLAHLDRGQDLHRIVDCRGARHGMRPNQTLPLSESFDAHMADGRGPTVCNDLAAHPLYARLGARGRSSAGAYVGVPLELADGGRVGALAAISDPEAFTPHDEQLLSMLVRVLAAELERETNERDVRRLHTTLRTQAQGMGELGRVARALAGDDDARPTVCAAACAVADAPIAFLLEPDGRAFLSTAAHGADFGQVTIQPRGDAGGRAFQSTESYFVPDARRHPAVGGPLVEATAARSAMFEPVLRDGQIAGVLILMWREPATEPSESISAILRLLAAQAAVAIEQAALRDRMTLLALTDPLTGLATRRVWEEELPRELARSRRAEAPVTVAVMDLDHMEEFNILKGRAEGDRLVKETAAAWTGELREVDLIARLEGASFAIVLPQCGLGEACDVLERLRAAVPRAQTACAGAARWDGEEPAELLVARAEGALAAAKAAGRDTTIAAD